MNRPYVYLFVVASVDGRISPGPNKTMNDPVDEGLETLFGDAKYWDKISDTLKNIHSPQVWMEGSNLLVKEDEKLRNLPPFNEDSPSLYRDFLPDNVVHNPKRKGWLAIVDGRGRCRSGYKGEEERPMIHFVSKSTPPEYLAFLQRENIPYLVAGEKKVDLKEILQKLKTKLKVETVFTTSGGKLSGALIRAGLLDEINIGFNPAVIGGYKTPSLFSSPDIDPPKIMPTRLELIDYTVEKNLGYVWLRYKVINSKE